MAKKRRVLIVDDEENFAYLAKMNLEQTGSYEVTVETNSAKAIDAARKVNPDVMLLDIIMPRKDGFEVLKALKKDPKTLSIPVIMLTAVSGNGAKREAAKDYSEGYLVKPVSLKELMAKIEDVLRRRYGSKKENNK